MCTGSNKRNTCASGFGILLCPDTVLERSKIIKKRAYKVDNEVKNPRITAFLVVTYKPPF